MITRGSFTVIQCKNITRTHNSSLITPLCSFVASCMKNITRNSSLGIRHYLCSCVPLSKIMFLVKILGMV